MFGRLRFMGAMVIMAVTAGCLFGQEWPKTIRGYRLLDPPRAVRVSNGTHAAVGPKIAIEAVEFGSIGLTGVNLTASAIVTDAGVSGTVDLMTFRDIRLNGISVQIAEYRDAFKLIEHGTSARTIPLELFLPFESAAKTAYMELLERRPKWSVTGTVLVFGRFRRFGFTFKRVVPVRVETDIDNPLPRI